MKVEQAEQVAASYRRNAKERPRRFCRRDLSHSYTL